jgi:hypothetical protein
MKRLMPFLAALVPLAGKSMDVPSVRITTDGTSPAITIVAPSGNQPILLAHDGTNRVVSISDKGVLNIAAQTNQIVWGATNTAPANTNNATKWVSVQVAGDTNAYRLPLYK